ncbi:GNAT family N-acetyltransferase [bacterium]|nr:GNAT family N-acetyltransferase [bacterium]
MDAPQLCLYSGGDLQLDAAIRALLGHKGSPYIAHVEDFLANGRDGSIEGLEWRFHLALHAGRPVANICLWEAGGIGLLGHVYTVPEHRGQGIASRLLSMTIDGARSRGLLAIDLNTEPGSPAAMLYERQGFIPRPWLPGSMILALAAPSDSGTESQWERFRWAHWPRLNEYCLQETSSGLPVGPLDLKLPASAEGAVLRWRFPEREPSPSPLWVRVRADGSIDKVSSRHPLNPI